MVHFDTTHPSGSISPISSAQVTPGFGDVMGYRDTFQDLRLLWRLDPQLKTIMNVPGPETGGSDAASAFARGPSLPETTKYLQPDPVQIKE